MSRGARLAVLTVALLCGCGAADSGSQSVCGGDGTGLVVRVTGGMATGLPLFDEVGLLYAVVEPSCRFAFVDTGWDRQGKAVVGTLSRQEASELSAALMLEEWESFQPTYGATVCDGGAVRLAVGDRVFDFLTFCGDAPFPPAPDAANAARERVLDAVDRLWTLGEPASGNVRYSLWRRPEVEPRASGTPSWPLDSSPESVATLEDDDDWVPTPTIHVAKGEDAEQLRTIRDDFLARRGAGAPFSASIHQPDGSLYSLWVRDVVEFEDADGRVFVPWVDLHQAVADLR